MRIKFTLLIILFAMTLSHILPAIAAENFAFSGEGYKSIEWQAIKFQQGIESKIKSTLRPMIEDSEYIVEARVTLDFAKAEEPTPKKKVKTVKSKKTNYSNVPFPEDGDDFIVFNKLGLEAPIVGEEPIVSEVSEAELAQKAAIELNERYNLFNFLDTITVNITFDKSVPEKTRSSIANALNTVSLYTKDIIPQFNVQYVELNNKLTAQLQELEKKNDSEKQRLLDQLNTKEKIIEERRIQAEKDNDRFKNLDIMIGLIVAALLVGATAIYINHNGSKVDEDLLSKNENNDKSEEELKAEEETENDSLTGEEDMIDLSKEDAITFKIKANLERFKTVFEHHRGETILMIKNWIRTAEDDQIGALNALVQVLSDGELAEIFKLLMIDERNTWKQLLVDTEFTKEEIAKHFTFVGNEIVKTMMVPPVVDDYEVSTLLLTVTAEEAAKYCEKYPDLSGVFANVLSSKIVSAMFKLLPGSLTLEIIENSRRVNKNVINERLPELKAILLKAKESKERPPFLKGIIDILPTALPEIEKKLYTTLLTYLTVEEASIVALKVLPAEIIDEMGADIFTMIMEEVEKDQQILYLASLPEYKRIEEISRFAAEGSKMRELLDLELETALADEIKMRQLMGDQKDQIRSSFFNSVRSVVAANKEIRRSLVPSVAIWLERIKDRIEREEKTQAA